MIVEAKNATEFETLTKDGTVLVDYYATWCAPCKRVANELSQITKEELNGVKIVKVDVDKVGLALVSKYGVSSIPTLILFKNGQPVARHTGALSKREILEFIRSN